MSVVVDYSNWFKFAFSVKYSDDEYLKLIISRLDRKRRLANYKKRRLTNEQVKQILNDTRTQNEIAREFGVNQNTISKIKRRVIYKDV